MCVACMYMHVLKCISYARGSQRLMCWVSISCCLLYFPRQRLLLNLKDKDSSSLALQLTPFLPPSPWNSWQATPTPTPAPSSSFVCVHILVFGGRLRWTKDDLIDLECPKEAKLAMPDFTFLAPELTAPLPTFLLMASGDWLGSSVSKVSTVLTELLP